jgi:WD40 repeat protein/serine/threonine protein kinase/Flp pilus assembly protein TadD
MSAEPHESPTPIPPPVEPPTVAGTGGEENGSERGRTFGDYELVEEIARGGMGVVYRARQSSVRRVVALKVIRPEILEELEREPEQRQAWINRFRAEAEAAAGLDHPHIVPIYEVGEHQGRPFFSMKLIEGGSLAQHLRTRAAAGEAGGMPPADAARLLATVARAVHHAHQRGILHRDLKPANILLASGGREPPGAATPPGGVSPPLALEECVPHVTDFGLARKLGGRGLTRSGAILGTPAYMSPEQVLAAKDLTTAVDVYGLGAIFYEMLTGRAPFQASNDLELYQQVVERDPQPPRALEPGVDRDLEVVCLKCLAKAPQRRYESAAALADDLDRWRERRPIRARPVSRWERVLMWARRRPAAAALLALGCLSATAFLVLVLLFTARLRTANADLQEVNKNLGTALVDTQRASQRAEREKKQARTQRTLAEERLAQANRSLYLQRVALARQAWFAGNVTAARALLEDCPTKLRRWEWHFLRRLHASDLRTLRIPGQTVSSVAYRPDGKRLASDGPAGSVLVWETASGKELLRLRGHTNPVTCVAFSPDGSRLASASASFNPLSLVGDIPGELRNVLPAIARQGSRGEVLLWDAAGKRGIALEGPPAPADSVAFSPDGRLLAAGGKGRPVRVWEVASGKRIAQLRRHKGAVAGVAFRPDGVHLAYVAGELRVWDVKTWKEAFRPRAAQTGANGLAYSPDSRVLALARPGAAVQMLDASTGQALHRLQGHTDSVKAVAFSPDGTLLASAAEDQTTRVWDWGTGKERTALRGHDGAVNAVAFNPDGRQLASGGAGGEIKLWDASQDLQEALTLRGGGGAIRQVHFSPDNAVLASTDGDDTVWTWDSASGRRLSWHKHGGQVTALTFHPEGRWLATASVNSGRGLMASIFPELLLAFPPMEFALAIWKEKRPPQIKPMIAFLLPLLREDRGEIHVWNPVTGKAGVALKGADVGVLALTFSPDGKRLVAGCADGAVRVWDTSNGRRLQVLPGHRGSIMHLAFSPDGRRLASAGGDLLQVFQSEGKRWVTAEIKVWDLAAGRAVFTLPHNAWLITDLVFSPDGQWLASASIPVPVPTRIAKGRDHPIELWNARTGKKGPVLHGHTAAVPQLVFGPGGKYLASAGGADGTVRLWDVAAGRIVHTLRGHAHVVRSVCFSRDGARLATASSLTAPALGKAEVKIWAVPSGREVLSLPGMTVAAFSPDGRRLASGGPDSTIRVWLADEPTPAARERRRRDWAQGRYNSHVEASLWNKVHKRARAVLFHLDRLIALKPDGIGLYLERLKILRELSEWKRAVADYTRLLALTPRQQVEARGNLHAFRGDMYAKMKGWEKAIADYTRAIALLQEKAGWVVHLRRGLIQDDLGRWEAAIADLTEAIRRKTDVPLAWSMRGMAYARLRQWDRALADSSEAIRRQPGEWFAWASRGQVYGELGRWAEARRDFREAIRRGADRAGVWDDAAVVCLGTGDEAGYRRACAELVGRVGRIKDPRATATAAWACVRLPAAGDPVQMLELALKSAGEDKDRASALTTLGAVLYRAGLFEAARQRLAEAEKAGGKEPNPVLHLFRAMTWHRLGRSRQAREALRRAVQQIEEAESRKATNWAQRLGRQVLRRETEALLKTGADAARP